MPYGFNEDKSTFDLADIDQSVEGTFTAAPATSLDTITNVNVTTWADGRIGCVGGTYTPNTVSTGRWVLIGTTDILPEVETGGTYSVDATYASNAMKLTTAGELYMYVLNNDNGLGKVHSFGLPYVVAR